MRLTLRPYSFMSTLVASLGRIRRTQDREFVLPELGPRPQPQWKGDSTSSVNCQLRRETTEYNLFLSLLQMHTFYTLSKKCIFHFAELYRMWCRPVVHRLSYFLCLPAIYLLVCSMHKADRQPRAGLGLSIVLPAMISAPEVIISIPVILQFSVKLACFVTDACRVLRIIKHYIMYAPGHVDSVP